MSVSGGVRGAAYPRGLMGKDPWDTPAMRQWRAIKAQHPDCVLFFRMGDFYELFGEDATTLARDLGLTLTKRSGDIPLSGVPHHQKANYLQKAIDLGYRVAVVDQLEDPSQAKGVVDRGVTQVVTAGTLVDESLLDDAQSTHLACVCFDDDTHAGVAVVELSTGHFRVMDGTVDACLDEVTRSGARELLHAGSDAGELPERTTKFIERCGVSASARPSWHFRLGEALDALEQTYGARGVEGFGLAESMACVRAAGAVVRYLRETQAVDRKQSDAASGSEFQRQRSTLAHLSAPTLIDTSGVCAVDATSMRSLEINETMLGGALEGSLAGVFLGGGAGKKSALRTAMGKRLVRSWLGSPLLDVDAIAARHDAVEVLVSDTALARALGERVGPIGDIARISGRLALGRATPRDLVALGGAAARVRSLAATIEGCAALAHHRETLVRVGDAVAALGERIVASCVEDAPAHLREGGLVRDGVDKELDDARGLERDAGAWLSGYQAELVEQHELPGLKVGYTKVFGYYIELPKAQAARAPDTLTRKQTLKNAERFITPELKAFEDKVMSAGARAVERERVIFDELCDAARGVIDPLGSYAHCVGELDVLLGFAQRARERGWVRPTVDGSRDLSIEQGRHPVLDETLGDRFVPNDCALGGDAARFSLITGPNMAGKSTYIRQCALLVVLAQCGSFVPADAMTVGVCDRVMTRVGSDDALHKGQSTFMVEMTETARILHNATARSLVILDEIGRGTSTLDGLSLAWAITEHLAGVQGDGVSGQEGPRTLFATHYHELTELESAHAGLVRNLHVAVREWTSEDGTQEIAFLHAIRAGSADQSYGVHVAKLAGVPRGVTARAEEILGSLSVQQRGRVETASVAPARREGGTRDASQMGLFTEFVAHPVVDELRELKLDTMSPMDAFDALRALRERAGSDDAGS